MPMDPTLGLRIYQTLLQKADLDERRRTGELHRQQLQQEIDEQADTANARRRLPGYSRWVNGSAPAPVLNVGSGALRTSMGPGEGASLQDADQSGPESTGGAPMLRGAAAVAPLGAGSVFRPPGGAIAAGVQAVAPALDGGVAPDTGPIFKMPKGYLPDAPMSVRSSPARARAAEDAKAISEARLHGEAAGLMDAVERHQAFLDGAGDPIPLEQQMVLASFPKLGGVEALLRNRHSVNAENRRAALSNAVALQRLEETARAHVFGEDQRERKIVLQGRNVETSEGRLGLSVKKFLRDNSVKGATAEEAASISGAKKKAEEAGRIEAQTAAGVNRSQIVSAQAAAAQARDAMKAGVSRENAILRAQTALTKEMAARGYDVAPALKRFDMELSKGEPGGWFGGGSKGKVSAKAPIATIPPDYHTEARSLSGTQFGNELAELRRRKAAAMAKKGGK